MTYHDENTYLVLSNCRYLLLNLNNQMSPDSIQHMAFSGTRAIASSLKSTKLLRLALLYRDHLRDVSLAEKFLGDLESPHVLHYI